MLQKALTCPNSSIMLLKNLSTSIYFKQAHNLLPYGGIMQSMTTPRYPINDTTTAYGYAWFTSTYRGIYVYDMFGLLLLEVNIKGFLWFNSL